MPPELSPGEQLMAMASGAWVTQMIHVAAELGLADAMADGERDCDDLATRCGADAGTSRLKTVTVARRNIEGGGRQGEMRHTDYRMVTGV